MSKPTRIQLGKGYGADGEECVCIPMDYFGVKIHDCEKCGLRGICYRGVSENTLDVIVDYLRKMRHRDEFWEEYEEELYDG